MTAIIISTDFGPMLAPPFDAYVAPALARYGRYCAAEFETWAPWIPEGGVVVDAGANIGAHTLPFAHAVGETGLVFAIEPQRMLANMLAGSVALCGVNNVIVKQIAIGRARGTVKIPPIDYSAPGNFGGLSLANVERGEEVVQVPLDEMGLSRLDFLKLDIEGMETEALAGAAQTIARCRPVMSIEADREEQFADLGAFLAEHDYRAWWHRPLLGDLWPGVVSINLFCIPSERAERSILVGVDEEAVIVQAVPEGA